MAKCPATKACPTSSRTGKLKPVLPDGTVTYGAQTHPGDGNAGMILTTREKARDMSRDPDRDPVAVRHGQHRQERLHAASAGARRTPCARTRRPHDRDVAAIKSHNPFIVNDIVFARATGSTSWR